MLNAEQVKELQDSEPTDFATLDQKLVEASNWDANRFASDHKLHIRWFTKPRLDQDASKAAGRAIFKDTEYIEIMVPGDKNNIIRRPAWSQDYQRFAKQYQAFKAGRGDEVVGTPLNLAPFLSEAQIAEFGYFKIRTLEQLADLPDSVAQGFMGAQEFKRQAQQMLAKMNSNEALLEKMNALQAELAELRKGSAGAKAQASK